LRERVGVRGIKMRSFEVSFPVTPTPPSPIKGEGKRRLSG